MTGTSVQISRGQGGQAEEIIEGDHVRHVIRDGHGRIVGIAGPGRADVVRRAARDLLRDFDHRVARGNRELRDSIMAIADQDGGPPTTATRSTSSRSVMWRRCWESPGPSPSGT